MKNKKKIVIITTSVIVLGLLFLAIKKNNPKSIVGNDQLKADFDSVIRNIETAKK